jgi:hypothetical protein
MCLGTTRVSARVKFRVTCSGTARVATQVRRWVTHSGMTRISNSGKDPGSDSSKESGIALDNGLGKRPAKNSGKGV